MLKASPPGNVLLKHLFVFSQLRQQQQQQFQQHRHRQLLHLHFGACRYFTFTQVRSSSFSSRFADHFEGTAESDAQVEGQAEKQMHMPDVAAEKKRLRSLYLPWARMTSQSRNGGRRNTKGADRRSRQTAKKSKDAGKTNTSESRHRARPAKARRRRNPKSSKSRDASTKIDTDENPSCDPSQQSSTSQIPLEELEARRNMKSFFQTLGEDIKVKDLSIDQLRAIILYKRTNMELAWDAYQQLASIDAEGDFAQDENLFGTELLTTLANRLVVQRKYHPKNCRQIFLRLLSVYARLRRERAGQGGVPYLRTVEWNCLIHFAGTGLRGRTSLEAYNAGLDVYDDMLCDVREAKVADSEESLLSQIEPDIYTYTTLLSIALHTEHQPAIDHAMKLLQDSGKVPSRVTHLSMIRYRYRSHGLPGVRALLSDMRPEDIGPDGINAYMECAGNEGDLDVVWNLYKALRENVEVHEDGTYGPHNKGPPPETSASDVPESRNAEKYTSVEGLRLPRTLVPSEPIYNYVTQICAYHGRLSDALQAFADMLLTRRPDRPGRFFQPNYAVFRGMFLGFARHSYRQDRDSSTTTLLLLSGNAEWTWEQFSTILDSFIDLGDKIQPSERMVYWIMSAVRRLTGDERLLRDVWARLNARWNIRKGGRLKTLDSKYGQQDDEPTE